MLVQMSPSLLRKEVVMGKFCIYAHENGCAHIYYLKVPLRSRFIRFRKMMMKKRSNKSVCCLLLARFLFAKLFQKLHLYIHYVVGERGFHEWKDFYLGNSEISYFVYSIFAINPQICSLYWYVYSHQNVNKGWNWFFRS